MFIIDEFLSTRRLPGSAHPFSPFPSGESMRGPRKPYSQTNRSLATLLLLPLLVQCHERAITAPDLPDDIRATAIRLRVDVAAGTIAPIQTPVNSDISLSLVGSDAVVLQTSNMSQTPLGKNKTLVRFDVAIANSLTNVTLIKPTVPAPPPGTTGVLLFPFRANALSGSGAVAPSTDWDGAPFNFFNDVNCTGSASSDCFRWEQYPAPIAPGATSAARTVGFAIDNDVQTFEVVMLVAADLQNVAPSAAAIALSPTTAEFQSSAGSMSSDESILVSNSGGGTLSGLTATITYGEGQPTGWLTATLSSTTAPSVLTLSAVSGALSDGTYNATVAVAAAGVSNSPQNVSVTLVVTGSVVANAIYVSESDPTAVDNSTCGLAPSFPGGTPCHSIAQGMARAVSTARSEVRVADGHYAEAVVLVNGKNLLGGYQPDTWQRHVTTTNTIIDGVSSTGNHDRAVIANNITSPTVFEGFVVRGPVNTKIGGNSYAIYVSGSSANLVIRRNAIYGGVGGPGAQGFTGSAATAGADGTGRESDPSGYDAKIATGSGPCDVSNNRGYSNGGVGFSGVDNISGGNGGGNACPTSSTLSQQSAFNGVAGQPGVGGGSAGTAGVGGLDFRLESSGTSCVAAISGSQVGGNGGPGGNGQHGAPGPGAATADGLVVGSHWVGDAGTSGVVGSNGGGGGGGGAGGGAYSQSTVEGKDRLGGVGGGGGAGGAAGGGGAAGSAGGGAFGIFIVGAAPEVTDNTIVQGTGGTGGGGGAGAAGATGGESGAGGLGSIFCTGGAGRGGDGGKGGTGSGGGGGAGGASFGIYTSGAGSPNYCVSPNNSVSGGAGGSGGQGGQSQANPGGAGVSGAVAACSFH